MIQPRIRSEGEVKILSTNSFVLYTKIGSRQKKGEKGEEKREEKRDKQKVEEKERKRGSIGGREQGWVGVEEDVHVHGNETKTPTAESTDSEDGEKQDSSLLGLAVTTNNQRLCCPIESRTRVFP